MNPAPRRVIFGADDITWIERAIASAVAPAFLLGGIFALLNVLTGRLARLIDRERAIRDGRSLRIAEERGALSRRAWAVNRAILASVVAAFLLCNLIVWSFVGGFRGLPVGWMLAALLVGAMLALITALLSILSEIRIASRHMPLPEWPEDG